MLNKNQISKQWSEYLQKLKVLRSFSSAQALLGWDRETYMPPGGSATRGETLSTLAGFAHQLFVDQEFVNIVNNLSEVAEELDQTQKRSLKLTKRQLDKSLKLPKAFVEKMMLVLNSANMSWLEARKTNNFKIFAPGLQEVLELKKQYAEYVSPEMSIYDVCLDDHEEGLRQRPLENLFSELKQGLGEILEQVLRNQHQSSRTSESHVKRQNTPYSEQSSELQIDYQSAHPFNSFKMNKAALSEFLHEMVVQVGFDMNSGNLAEVEHPFCTSIGLGDTRITTSFRETDNDYAIMGTIHELGHGLYEQNIDSSYNQTELGQGVSLAIHESQSRLLENIIGRSSEYWQYFYPRLCSYFPELTQFELSELSTALNHVSPSLIRTESDEVTYNLHIIVRFEIEKALFSGELKVEDLPEMWRSKMKEVLGVEPIDDRTGVLQDVHWSWGSFGYFPTYTLGNLNAAQLFEVFEKNHPGWRVNISKGDFSEYRSWFKSKVWSHGARYTSEELMMSVTGAAPSPAAFLKYLKRKYLLSEK